VDVFSYIHGVVRATSYFYGEWQNWKFQNSERSEQIVTKFGMSNYVGDMTPQDKIQSNRLNGASRQMGEILLLRGY